MSLIYSPPPDQGLDIVYQDDFLLAINKPAGLLSVPGKGEQRQDSLASRVQCRFADARVVHRLDMATSGIIMMALDPETHRQLNGLFEQRRISKQYIALVSGLLQPPQGEIDLPLICDWPNRPRQMVDHQRGKHALTRYRLIEQMADHSCSRVELMPVTGRSHQLRVHMQAIGHAILGDRLYASEPAARQSSRLMLHASMLSFIHPATGQALQLYSPASF